MLPGSIISSIHFTCTADINECAADTNGCAHNCSNNVGSYTCSLFSFYVYDLESILFIFYQGLGVYFDIVVPCNRSRVLCTLVSRAVNVMPPHRHVVSGT